MADITMCSGKNCPLSQDCYRYTATKSSYQSVFVEPPFNKETKTCSELWTINRK